MNLLRNEVDFSLDPAPFTVDGTVDGTGDDLPVLSGIEGVGAKWTPFKEALTGLRGNSEARCRIDPNFCCESVDGLSSGPGPLTRSARPLLPFWPMLLSGGSAKGKWGFEDVTVALDKLRECAGPADSEI